MLQKNKELNSDLSQEEYIRYSKQIILKQIGIEGQHKLKNAKILIIGAGGLGCPIMLYLVSSGIGFIGIIDKDHIEQSNLNRQILYNQANIKEPKAECAKKKLQTVNQNTKIIAHKWQINSKNSLEVISYYDIIIDATDNFKTRNIIDIACYKLHKTYIHGAIDEFEGEIAILNYKNGLRYEHLYKHSLQILENSCSRNGVMGISTGYIGLLQAIETIKTLLGLDKKCKNKIIRHSILKSRMQKKLINPSRKLKTSQNNLKERKEIINTHCNIIIIDLREEEEFRKKHAKQAINIPITKLHLLQTKMLIINFTRNKSIIICCNEEGKSIVASEILDKYQIPHKIGNVNIYSYL